MRRHPVNETARYQAWKTEHNKQCRFCGDAPICPRKPIHEEKPVSQNRPSDTAKLASWAQEALAEERLELAEALVRLALQASRMDKKPRNGGTIGQGAVVHVPFAGQTRPEVPMRAPRPAGPTGDGEADLEREARAIVQTAATAVFNKPTSVPDARRCMGWMEKDGVAAPCSGGLYYSDERRVWLHVDHNLDGDHTPIAIVE
jgi:hypothetical protein